MTPLHLALGLGLVSLAILAGLSRAVERFIGWRYLFRRRRGRAVALFTAVTAAATTLFLALFFLVPWPPGSIGQSVLAFLSVITLMVLTFAAFMNFFSVFTTVSITGVFCGVATLVVVLSVTSGFQQQFQEKVLGVNAHVVVLKYGLDFSEYRDVIKTTGAIGHVSAAAPFVFNEMMIRRGPVAAGVLVKGVVPDQATRVLDIDMQKGSVLDLGRALPAPAEQGGDPGPLPAILLGKELARRLKAEVGDRVRLVSPLAELDPSLWTAEGKAPRAREFRVGGVFYSGFDEYDRRLVYIDLKEAQRFVSFGDVVTGVELRTDDLERSDRVAERLDEALRQGWLAQARKDGSYRPDMEAIKGSPYKIIDWRELNHNLFTALKLQKVALAILLTLIVLVAAFGIVATLTMLVIDKTREIAILKSVGMRERGIARLFQTAGLTIGALGTLAGVGLGLTICALVSHYRYRLDPRVYLIDQLPVKVSPTEVLLTAVVTMGICLLATIYPARRAAGLKPVEGLRYE